MRLAMLFVDDSAQLRSVIGEYISAFGIHCFPVGTVLEANRVLKHELVDVMVTDLLLDRRPSHALIETACARDIRTIVASALIKENIKRSLGALAERVLIIEKPFDLSHLRRLITLDARASLSWPPVTQVVTPA